MREFSELLPRRVNIEAENDLLSFQFTSEWAGIVAQYIIGLAASISGDLESGERLFRDSLRQVRTKSQAFPIYAKLVERIPVRLSQIYETKAERAHRRWIDTHDDDLVLEIGSHLDNVIDSRKDERNVLFLRAIHAFLEDRNVDQAMEYFGKMRGARKGSSNPAVAAVWNYNVAFLRAYAGDLRAAIRHYRRAAAIAVEPDILDQIESFLCWIVENEPDKYQIYFCLGFFNWKTKGDFSRAEKDLKRFLDSGNAGDFETERRLALKWIAQLKAASQIRDPKQRAD